MPRAIVIWVGILLLGLIFASLMPVISESIPWWALPGTFIALIFFISLPPGDD